MKIIKMVETCEYPEENGTVVFEKIKSITNGHKNECASVVPISAKECYGRVECERVEGIPFINHKGQVSYVGVTSEAKDALGVLYYAALSGSELEGEVRDLKRENRRLNLHNRDLDEINNKLTKYSQKALNHIRMVEGLTFFERLMFLLFGEKYLDRKGLDVEVDEKK